MGPAQSTVINKTHKKICVITFNNADLLYTGESFLLTFTFFAISSAISDKDTTITLTSLARRVL